MSTVMRSLLVWNKTACLQYCTVNRQRIRILLCCSVQYFCVIHCSCSLSLDYYLLSIMCVCVCVRVFRVSQWLTCFGSDVCGYSKCKGLVLPVVIGECEIIMQNFFTLFVNILQNMKLICAMRLLIDWNMFSKYTVYSSETEKNRDYSLWVESSDIQ